MAIVPLAFFASCAEAYGVQAETVLMVDSSPPCVIDLSPGPPIRGAVEGDWVDDLADVQILEDGRLAAVGFSVADGFLLMAPDAGVEWVGRSGDGPGEYRYIRWVRPRGDRLHVFDVLSRRRTVLDANLDVVLTNPLLGSLAGDAAIFGDSAYVVNGPVPTPENIGYALHLFDASGAVVRSFDELPGGYGTPDSGIAIYRRLAVARDGGLWSAYRGEYRIDLWDPPTGTRLRTLVRPAEWFPAHAEPGSNDPERPALPTILDIVEDAAGRLWVLLSIASDRWAEGFEETPEGAHPELDEYLHVDFDISYDTMVEVIDPARGRLLATTTVDQNLHVLRGGRAVSSEEGEFGLPTIQLWQLGLTAANTQGDNECM
ncbi:hypothetical protein [Candidatus Palauibacter sp.]|uniref:hypothetical protein n=1 Tax=Candidatus Palauibacter sp. TaxID=3101350 RepID=UPI003B01D597